MKDVRKILTQLAVALDETREPFAELVRNALTGSDEQLEQFLVSNDLWGGSGSIADSAFNDAPNQRSRFYELMVELGKLQIEAEKTNIRTRTWVSAFEQWARSA